MMQMLSASGALSVCKRLLETRGAGRVNIALVYVSSLLCVLAFVPAAQGSSIGTGLVEQALIKVSPQPRRFDLMTIDVARHRLLAAHSRADALTVVDLHRDRLLAEIPVGSESAGVAVDTGDGKYYVGTRKGVAVINARTLKMTHLIATPGPVDAMVFDARNHDLYAAHDDGTQVWTIDTRSNKIKGMLATPAAPELMAIDARLHRLYVNIKPRNQVMSFDTVTGKALASWSTLPTRSPHGLVLNPTTQRMYIAGRSHQVTVYALPSGKRGPNIGIGPGWVDQIALDTRAHRLYCPSSGRLMIIQTSGRYPGVLGSIAIPGGTHSIAVDPRTHWVWISFAGTHGSYVEGLAPEKGSQTYKGERFSSLLRIGVEEARAVALQAYPGVISAEELEKAAGGSGLRFSFDISRDRVTHEIGVDAITGKVLENKRVQKPTDS